LTELENLHLTLKFLGEINEEKLVRVIERLNCIEMKKFEGNLDKIGTFNIGGVPRIVWVKIGGAGIFELQKKVDSELEKEGFEIENKFMSHMTIARIKYVNDKDCFREYAGNIGLKKLKFDVKEFKLKKSELMMLGPVYTDLGIFKLE
jgi:RNA 2',3'-cyclic 3'-phosphodiesterase